MVDSFAKLVIAYSSPYPGLRRLSRLSHQPFELDMQRFASLQAFWLSLQFERKRDGFLWNECVQQHGPDALKFAGLCRTRAKRNGGALQLYYFESTYTLDQARSLLERALRTQVRQNLSPHDGPSMKDALLATRGHELEDGDKDTGIDTFSPEEFTRIRLKVRDELASTDDTKSRLAGTKHDPDAGERASSRLWHIRPQRNRE